MDKDTPLTPAARPAARRTAEIHPFEVMEVLARAQQLEASGRRIIHMEIGEPDFTAPEPVVVAGIEALHNGSTQYTAALGLAELREAISDHYRRAFGADVPSARIAITAGASAGLLLTVALYVNPGDEVLVPDPGYPGYRHLVRAFGGTARSVRVLAAEGYQPTLEGVREAWGPRTIGLLLGSPGNPSGTLVSPDELRRIAEFIASRGGIFIVDEIYQGLVYETEAASAASLSGEIVLVNSFSKYFCMTGWRLGWIVLPAQRIRQIEPLIQHLYICPSAPAQHAALRAFDAESIGVLELRRAEFQRRRDHLLPRITGAGLRVPAKPSGAFYIYADCSEFATDSRQFALQLLEKEGVAVTPGVDFGSNETHRYIRMAYTRTMNDLDEAARRIERFCGE